MKINDLDKNIKSLDEGIGDWLSRQGLRGKENQEAAITKRKDDLTYKIGLKNFKNEINNSLTRAISSGEVDPKKTSTPPSKTPAGPASAPDAATSAASTAAQPANQAPIKIGGQTLDPSNPADKKIIDKIQAQQGDADSAPASQSSDGAAPETPAQKRARKQQAAAAAAQSQMSPKQTASVDKTPAQIRAEKQATAATAAQQQMTAKPEEPELPGFLQSKIKGRRTANEGQKFDQYELFNSLLEAAILGEQDDDNLSIADYLNKLFKAEVYRSGLTMDSRSKNLASSIINQIEAGYKSTKRIDDKLTEKLWNVLWSISKTSSPTNYAGDSKASLVAAAPSNSPEAQQKREQFLDNIKGKLNQVDINSKEGTQQLAKLVADLAKYVSSSNPDYAAIIANAIKAK